MAVEEPRYSVERAEASMELRQYPGFVVAETWVQGDFDSAGRTGFRRIAGYIFGKNLSTRGDAEKIAMTAPVTMAPGTTAPVNPAPASERIAMTAPVTMQADAAADAGSWRVHFVMPSAYKLADLPRPLDADVKLREVPAHRVAAITFSGWTTRASIAENTGRLQGWMAKLGLKPASAPQVARYNDPFTLPWNRRNEILIEVAP
ncbi:MAG: heme-binding protein [Rhodocyclaceae bacterium]|nr:heme-binding protein [Rhodocyclaceae bacterium]